MTNKSARQQRESIEDRLNELRQRETSPGADSPQPAAFADAEAFSRQLPSPLSRMPHISLADDGEINFAWNGTPVYIDLGFHGTGTYSYFARDKQGRKHHGDDVPANGPIPDPLVEILSGLKKRKGRPIPNMQD